MGGLKKSRCAVEAEPLYDVYEVAEYLKVDHTTVRSYLKRGTLEFFRLDLTGPIRIKLSSIQAFIDREPEPNPKRYQPWKAERELTLSEAWTLKRQKVASKGGSSGIIGP